MSNATDAVRNEEYDELVDAYNAAHAASKALEAEKKEIAGKLIKSMFADGVVDYVREDGKMKIRTKKTETIKREKLLAAGVEIDVILGATDRTDSEPFLQWYAKGARREKGDGGDDDE